MNKNERKQLEETVTNSGPIYNSEPIFACVDRLMDKARSGVLKEAEKLWADKTLMYGSMEDVIRVMLNHYRTTDTPSISDKSSVDKS